MNNKFVQASMITDRSKKIKTIDSREVAEMLGTEHKYVLRSIEGTEKVIGIIPTLESANLHYQDYFIESTYKSGTRKYKCYLCTKLGCEMLGNKLQGEKGILFTAKYVKRFNDMENAIQNSLPIGLETMQGMAFLSENMAAIGQHVQVLTQFTMGLKEYVQDSIKAKDKQIDDLAELVGIRSKNKCDLIQIAKNILVRKYNLSRINSSMEVYKRAKAKIFKEFNVTKWEDIPATKYNAVQAFIEECL